MTKLRNEPDGFWHPLLTGTRHRQGQEAVEAIAEACLAVAQGESHSEEAAQLMAVPSLSAGFGGPALLFAHLEHHRPDRGFGDAAIGLANRALQAVAEHPTRSSLFDGFAGVAWLTNHLERLLFGSDDAALSEEVDSALLQILEHDPWTGEYDLSRGLVGWGVYALDRLPEPAASRCLDLVLQRLEEEAEERKGGLGWYTPPRTLPDGRPDPKARGYFDLGVAHGLAGVIGFLGAARLHHAHMTQKALDRVDRMLEGAVCFLLSCRLESSAPSSFPSVHLPGMETAPSRAAWCQGDAGIAATLFRAALATGREDWYREALYVARRAARRELEGSWVMDAGLCHGAAGLGHVFNRFFQHTGEPVFAEVARRWFEQAMSMRREGRGVAGFAAWTKSSDGEVHWREDPGFLIGAAGVGLALLAALGDSEPEWDGLLLLPDSAAKSSYRANT